MSPKSGMMWSAILLMRGRGETGKTGENIGDVGVGCAEVDK